MFSNTIDSKYLYTNNDNTEMLDLTDTIFKTSVNANTVFSYYRVKKDMEMRPDKISFAAYGSDMYTEMIMKYSFVDNPFAIEYKDIVAVPTLSMIYTDVKDVYIQRGNPESDDYAFVKNYHKYIDKSKIPSSYGSSGAGNLYEKSGTGTSLLSSSSSSSGASLYVNTAIGNSYYSDLDTRESYGNIMGYGSDYNLTDGNDESYSGGYADYNGVNTLDSNGYPVREEYPTDSSKTSYDNGLNPGFSGGSNSGKSATTLNNDIYGSRGYGQGGGTYGDGSYTYNTGLLSNGVTYDDNDDIITETLYDENGNEIQVKKESTNTDVFNPNEYGPVEPNMANNNTSGITVVNGRIYFGDSGVSSNPNDITDVNGTNQVDNPLVDCARTGISLGQFLNATTKNTLKYNR